MTVSLILPYWDRQAAADKAIRLLAKTYADLTDFEVIVVDDGNAVPFVAPYTPLNLRVVRLPVKAEPCSAVVAWNAGVKVAAGDIIILSCVEILHTSPVIPVMVENLRAVGPLGNIHAAVWCPEQHQWHSHTSVRVPTCPPGTALHFCSAMYRSLYDLAGGMDEDYRNGAGYDDNDFVHRLCAVGAQFVLRDDLVVTHPKTGASIRWGPEALARNHALYLSKWPPGKPVTILCLKAGDAYGPEYVNILFDMVRRNLVAGYPGRFVCLTDDPTGLEEGIETIPLPADLETWWGKLYMFKRGLFKDGERVIFMDLDTLIVGNLAPLVAYDGPFATLRDFYHPERLGPAVIAWKAGEDASQIWSEWVAEGCPRHPMGDLWWLNTLDNGRFAQWAGKLQDLFSGLFCSFKVDCHPYPPKGTAIVCFHGQPKPDNCGVDWVAETWKVGGGGFAELEAVANTNYETTKANILYSCSLDLPHLEILPAHDRQCVIVAGGPSIHRTLPEVRQRITDGQDVFAVNGSAAWLNQRGIVPDALFVIDARPENADFLNSESKRQFLASQVDRTCFAQATDATVFHMNTEGIADILPEGREYHLISSGTTVGLAAMAVAYTQGYRAIHLHGFDSSYEDDHHAYPQKQNDADQVLDVAVEGRKFKAAPWMVKQAQQFQELALQLSQVGVIITVAGDGLLPHIAHCMSKGD
jgi:uncharacterized Rossmann fold enzyme